MWLCVVCSCGVVGVCGKVCGVSVCQQFLRMILKVKSICFSLSEFLTQKTDFLDFA